MKRGVSSQKKLSLFVDSGYLSFQSRGNDVIVTSFQKDDSYLRCMVSTSVEVSKKNSFVYKTSLCTSFLPVCLQEYILCAHAKATAVRIFQIRSM